MPPSIDAPCCAGKLEKANASAAILDARNASRCALEGFVILIRASALDQIGATEPPGGKGHPSGKSQTPVYQRGCLCLYSALLRSSFSICCCDQ